MKSILAAAALFLATSMASAQSSQPTVQQQFETASSALGDENWAEALRLYEALEARVRNNARSLAVVRIRKAEALARLRRFAEADEAIRLGLPQLPAGDPSLAEDRLRAHRISGTIAELSFDFAEAARRYQAGIGLDGPLDIRLALHRGVIQNLIFSDREAALRAADEALRIIDALPDNRRLRGQFRTLRGRALLNLGRNGEALAELRQAVQLLGGMTTRVDASDIFARSDLALAALFAGDEQEARRYLALTGAGRFRTGALNPYWSNLPPPCGNGLRPEDVAVIQFSVALDGSVLHAQPVYATTPQAAREMGRAVQGWYFQPRQLGSLHALFRALSRVELRCSRVETTPYVWRAISMRYGPDGRPPRAETVADLRAALARLDGAATRNREEILSALAALMVHPGVAGPEAMTYVARALAIVRTGPADPMLAAELLVVSPSEDGLDRQGNADNIARALAQPLARERPAVAAALHLTLARTHYYEGRYVEALADLAALRAAAGSAPESAFRGEALALEAMIRAAQGDMDGAGAARLAIGPGAPRCGPQPRMLNTPGRDSDFPMEALRWGFEGWAMAEASIQPDGRVAEARRVIAYPPFVFGEATEGIIARARYERGNAAAGERPCTAQPMRVMFRMPD